MNKFMIFLLWLMSLAGFMQIFSGIMASEVINKPFNIIGLAIYTFSLFMLGRLSQKTGKSSEVRK